MTLIVGTSYYTLIVGIPLLVQYTHISSSCTMDIPHSEACLTLPRYKRCNECNRAYRRELSQRNKPKKRSIYYDLLCDSCNDKPQKDYCDKCITKYTSFKSQKCRSEKKRKLDNENQIQSNQPNLTECSGSGRTGSSCSGSNIIGNFGSGSKKQSIYADILCITCQNKPTKEYCPDCRRNYTNARSRNY